MMVRLALGVVIATIAIVTIVIAITALTTTQRRHRAIRRAQWEPFEQPDTGKLRIGVRLTARWGDHHETLAHDTENDEHIDIDDIVGLAEARGRAENRATIYNQTRRQRPNWKHHE